MVAYPAMARALSILQTLNNLWENCMSHAPEGDGAQRAWESFVSERDLFISVYGLSYGNEPETRKAVIREGMKGYVE